MYSPRPVLGNTPAFHVDASFVLNVLLLRAGVRLGLGYTSVCPGSCYQRLDPDTRNPEVQSNQRSGRGKNNLETNSLVALSLQSAFVI